MKIVIIAGPNGAGKTTFAQEFLPHEADCPLFINADLIAAGLSPFDPAAAAIRAGRVMLEEIDRNFAERRSFAFETTLAGHTYARRIPTLATPEDAIARVANRVRQGGHDIEVETIRRRFASGMRNFLETYRRLVTYWQWLDNNGAQPRLITEGKNL